MDIVDQKEALNKIGFFMKNGEYGVINPLKNLKSFNDFFIFQTIGK